SVARRTPREPVLEGALLFEGHRRLRFAVPHAGRERGLDHRDRLPSAASRPQDPFASERNALHAISEDHEQDYSQSPMSLRAAYLVHALRSPIGKHRGALSAVRADDLAA